MRAVENKRVICPYCGYRMPVEYTETTNCSNVYLKCKGSHCKREFELVIKNGTQLKHSWIYEKITGIFYSIFE